MPADMVKQTAQMLGQYGGLAAGWLFGSRASGQARPDSDLDIALLADRPLTLKERVELQLQLMKLWGLDAVDLVDLRQASALLAFEAICGQPLFAHDPSLVAEWVSRISRRYEEDVALMNRELPVARRYLPRSQG